MKSVVVAIALGVVLAVLSACGGMSAKSDAERVASTVFSLIENGEFESALDYYSEEFYESRDRDRWLAVLCECNEQLGDLVSYELSGWEVNSQVGSNSEPQVILVYGTEYTGCEAVETLSLKEEQPSGFRITGHEIESSGLLLAD
jgi:hypothetical protein